MWGHFTTFSLGVYQGKNPDGSYKPDGWASIKVFGELGESLELSDKQKVTVSGYPIWNDGVGEEKKYRGWEFHATSVVADGQSASQKKEDDSCVPF